MIRVFNHNNDAFLSLNLVGALRETNKAYICLNEKVVKIYLFLRYNKSGGLAICYVQANNLVEAKQLEMNENIHRYLGQMIFPKQKDCMKYLQEVIFAEHFESKLAID